MHLHIKRMIEQNGLFLMLQILKMAAVDNNQVLNKMEMGTYTNSPSHQEKSTNWQLLLQKLTTCTSKACKIIHQSTLKQITIKYKSETDPVSQIDHTIQKLITTELSSPEFEGINLVGEEQIDETMIDHHGLDDVNTSNSNQRLFEGKTIFPSLQGVDFNGESVLNKDVCVFVDPLDCTRGYVCGKFEQCTVLIGITVKGRPVLGIIGQPFRKQNSKLTYQPRIIVGGSVFSQKIYYQYSENSWTKNHRTINPEIQSPMFAVSSRRCSQKQNHMMTSLRANRLDCGGSGNKLAMIIRGQVDAVCFVECPLSTWDSCAGQAIILGLGGVFTRPNNTPIQYSEKNTDQTLHSGYICCLNSELHQKIMLCFKNYQQHHHH